MVDAPRDDALRVFPAVSAIDTCAVWNILSSRTLSAAISRKGCHFVLAEYVRYECLGKPRTNLTEADAALCEKLKTEITSSKQFSVHPLGVDDLRDLVATVGSPKRFHHGEVAALALSRKLGNGFLTDDYAARKVGENTLGQDRVRSTPLLVGWLVYDGQLTDGDIPVIVADNKAYRNKRGFLGSFIQKCYEHAMGLRLRDRKGV
ncbi:hypothetical protein J2848_004134 [Azospirillum lipoferum]|uniref:PIN domain-containing protein n=1 Tax=Azospirillum lipoferum TaxID=193 RepID=A0A5A9GHK0_AZOLI|nr:MULTISPECIES: hypothetical protein [Azospirillum]KAA0593968.1 hypothetical protein FZ942_21250 [Azospirillum lipoferum]MCP1612443.1 hypothetical protein [Azospirillum lipoferum]MDW5531773.1 hypothetical protein [Azospirillum sp. NL1]